MATRNAQPPVSMIESKPKTNTLFSLGIFMALALGVSGYTLRWMYLGGEAAWYHFAVVGVLAPFGLAVLAKTILGYKVVRIVKEKVVVHYPFRFSRSVFAFKSLKNWQETTIKTASGPFNQLEIRFAEGTIKLGKQENTNYGRVLGYLTRKHAKKRIT